MAELIVVRWRDIPAQVIIKQGRRTAKRQLSERFEKAIDRAAMRAGLRDSDAYLGEWHRTEPETCGDDLEAEATAAAARIAADSDAARLVRVGAAGGREGA
ncbi:MAG: virulence factor [Dongiaceae bacterium]